MSGKENIDLASAHLDCDVTIQDMNPVTNAILKSQLMKGVVVSLGRNSFKDLIICVTPKRANTKSFTLQKDAKIFKKFAANGKASIQVTKQNIVMISNCAPQKLCTFLNLLDVKSKKTNVTKGYVASAQHRLENGLVSSSFDEISPITNQEAKQYGASRNPPDSPLTQGKSNSDPSSLTTPKLASKTMGSSLKRKSSFIESLDEASRDSTSQSAFSNSSMELSGEQKRVIECVMKGESVFFTGSAGTGKSFLLKQLIRRLPPDTTYPTASTGIAACHINGTTLHSFAGLGTASAPAKDCLMNVLQKPHALRNYKKCRILIIDEISMVDADYFDKVEYVARHVMGNNQPFGGIQLIVSGDFFQLPPISRQGAEKKKFCFQAASWNHCINKTIELKEVRRQNEERFIKILQLMRIGHLPDQYVELLRNTGSQEIEKDGITATNLCTHKADVESMNNDKIEKLPGEERVFEALDSGGGGDAVKLNAQLSLAPQILKLKIGAQVMLTKNISVSQGMVNGARGVVVGFNPEVKHYPVVKFMSGAEKTIMPEKWTVFSALGENLFRKQIPLTLAWAMSIHKSQGMTLDCVSISLGKVFECGQAYVALSRAKSLNSLRVLDIESSVVRADPTVLKYYVSLRKQQIKSHNSIADYVPLGHKSQESGAMLKRLKTM